MLRIVEVKESGVVLIEGSDAARCEEQVKNVAHCPLPILDTSMYPARYYRGPSVHCRVCGTRHRGTKMVLIVMIFMERTFKGPPFYGAESYPITSFWTIRLH